MTPEQLIAWRSRMGWSVNEAARQLGLSRNGYLAYERGYADIGKKLAEELSIDRKVPRPIPRLVEWGCDRLEQIHGKKPSSEDDWGFERLS